MIFKGCGKKQRSCFFAKSLKKSSVGFINKTTETRGPQRNAGSPFSSRGLTAPELVSVQDDF